MVDGTCGNLIIARKPNKNRQSGGIGRCPGVGALLVNGHVPDGRRVGAPFPALHCGIVKLIEPAAIFFKHQHVTIAVTGLRVTFDERVGGNWLRAGIAFIRVGIERYRNFRLASRYNLIGNADRLVAIGASSKIGMERHGAPDVVDVIRRIRVDRRAGYVGVPQTSREERHKTVQTGELARCHAGAGPSLRKCGCAKENDSGED